MKDQISIVIADDHSICRKGLIVTLQKCSTWQVTGQASNGKELIELVEQLRPNLVITDIQMPLMNGFEATAIITRRFPDTKVLAFTMCQKELSISKMLQAGAKAYLLKTANSLELVNTITSVIQNDRFYFTSNSSALVKLSKSGVQNDIPRFNEKELSIINLICQQYSNKEIALKIGCSKRSVESTRVRIQEKIGAKNMVGIVLYAIKHSLFCVE